jgi:2-polyprenyl-6-hydroxyphenyl methylase/3-demethylubiquinone-9 3-methyltransferase
MASEMRRMKAPAARPAAKPTTIDPAEIASFGKVAARWWDTEGEFRPLHRLNPARLGFIRDNLAAHFGRDIKKPRPFAGLSLLDIGCGGGIVAEPLARLGFAVTGIDADRAAIAVARDHAEAAGLEIDDRVEASEDLARRRLKFDAVLALEVVEHVADIGLFLKTAAALVKPGGALIASTINRTPQAFLFAIIGAEYVLRWVPRGTHHWSKFVRPSELAAGLRENGLEIGGIEGMSYDARTASWRLGGGLAVNYLLFASKAGGK